MNLHRLVLASLALLLASVSHAADPKVELKDGDRIAIIGNTLADRMQHDAWLDAYLHTRFAKLNLSIRHMGFSADEVGGFKANPEFNKRLRSANFGSNDEWMYRVKADVIFAFFGYNESFADKEGLTAFKADLDSFVKHAKSQTYNGRVAPRVVLFSPVAQEPPRGRKLPDPVANNARLELYTAAIAEVAKSNDVPFVDLFRPTAELYQKVPRALTINGIHLTSEGNQVVAHTIDTALFGDNAPRTSEQLEKTRKAALDRNFHWHQRYRATDGYSVFGGRSTLVFEPEKQTNRVVAQRELEILDVMTANRDKVVNAAAQGRDLKPDDSNTPDFIPVKTNKPGPLDGGKHLFVGGEDAIKLMTLGKGLKVNLFADEKMFPELAKPVQMAFDPKGRLWVAVWPSYPHWKPKDPLNDKLIIFEDTDGDGKADKRTVFADGLHNPTGFEFYNGGVIVAQAPDLMFLKDTDGDDKADIRERILHGLDSADTHHTANSFVLDPGGALYFQEGTFHHTQVETPYGPPARVANGAVFRYEPRTQKFEVYVSYGFANPHGHVFDSWGQDIVVDGTGANPYHAPLFSGYLPAPTVEGRYKHARPPHVYQQRTRPCGGIEYLYSKHFPQDFWGNLIVTNCIGFQGLLRYKIEDDGASFQGTELEPILYSSDPNFRPVDAKTGPDGAIYFIDWHNPIIGHMQHNLRDPNRDSVHGRIYRVTHERGETVKPVSIAGESLQSLLNLLKSPVDRDRYRAKIELGARPTADVISATNAWLAGLDKSEAGYEHHRLEALWMHQYHDNLDIELLKQVLTSPDFRARSAAIRVLNYWRDRVPDALELLKVLAADSHPRVRLEAVWAASFQKQAEALEVVLIAQEKGPERFVDFQASETLRALDPLVKKAIADGREIKFTTAAGKRYFLRNVATEDLLKLKKSAAVYTEILARPGVRDEVRRDTVTELAKLESKSELEVLLAALRVQDRLNADESIAFDLTRTLTSRTDLASARGELEQIATGANSPVLRQMGFVSLIAADGSADRAWAVATKSVVGLRDFVTAVPQVRDPNQRAALYPKMAALLGGLPPELAATLPKRSQTMGRYVRIELPGNQRTLTLAEVEVFSDGKNVARGGKASQSSTAHGGSASRGIDGNKSGAYEDGGQTHTREGTNNPWWEVDLGAEYPVDSVSVFNRTDTNLSNRLNNFALKVLDKDRKVIFQKAKNPTPVNSVTIPVGGESPERVVRRVAMLAMTSVRGKEAETFKALAKFVKDPADRPAAVHAIQRIPAATWPKEDAPALLATLTEYVATVPTAERTSPVVLDVLQFADTLAGLLPREQAKAARKQLGELGVRVIRVGTLTDQMLFDKERIIVQAGKPVEFVFENTDIMPHNFVITQMGALEEVGNAAEAFGTQPGAQARHFVPPSNKVLLSSHLLQPREGQTLRFTAPSQPGVYPYVCTYPGHWRRMHGALYVVADLDEYLAEPEAYLAKNSVPIADDLLKFNRPRTEWKLDELVPLLAELDKGGRSFTYGKRMFTIASCVSCHKFGNEGQEFGPDLAKLDPNEFKSNADLLKHLLDPTLRIEDKYKQYTFNLADGGSVTAMVLEEKDGVYKVIENPLTKAEPRLIKAADLDGRPKPSMNSIMPKGLLDKLTKDEILDLLAYVAAKADPKHKYFVGGHDHHH